jgi:hypothetical protein
MNERRIGLEKVNVSVEPAKDGRRPKLALEASNIRTGSGRRGSGVDMCSKEKRVNMGSPPWREERSQPAIREEQAGLRRVAERSVVCAGQCLVREG